MRDSQRGILILSFTFSPNTGGVETHLDDLVELLNNKGYIVYVHTYSPITTPGVPWLAKEQRGNIFIRRYRWFGKSLLHKIEKIPILDFLYITPYLFIRVFLFMIFNHKKVYAIHAHGLNAAFIGKYIKKIFKKRLIVSMHALYNFHPKQRLARYVNDILKEADLVLALAKASYYELLSLGLSENKVAIYRYWISLEIFRDKDNKDEIRKKLGLENKFTVLFVGRLTQIKGIKELVMVAKKLNFLQFVFIGNGPLGDYLRQEATMQKNIRFLGRVNNKDLPDYYNIGDIFCIPSQYNEGFARVMMEAVACGLPIVASNKGCIPEALDSSVAILVDPTVENLTRAIATIKNDKNLFLRLQSNTRKYAETYFGESNSDTILKAYQT